MAITYQNKLTGNGIADIYFDPSTQLSPINDMLIGNGGDDDLRGGWGDDFLSGNKGNDILYGNRGDDVLLGGAGNDSLFGNFDEDIIDGGFGADLLRGDSGNGNQSGYVDLFQFHVRTAGFANKKGALASDTMTDFEAGIDVLQFIGYSNSTQRIYTQEGFNVRVSLDTDNDGIGNYDLVLVSHLFQGNNVQVNLADVVAASVDIML